MTAPSPGNPSPSAPRGPLLTLVLLALAVAAGGWYWMHRGSAPANAAGTPTADGAATSPGKPGGSGGPGAPGGNKGARGGVPSVVVAPARIGDLDIWSDSLGTVTPIANVTIHSRVDGQLLRVLFHEGQQVRNGELLAEIDPRPFQVVLDQALAQLAKDRALLDNARVDLARYQDLADHDAVPRQQLDTQVSLVAQYEATLRNDDAAIASARLNLSFCRIESPVDGQVGLRQIDPGNMVHAADTTGLVTVARMDPISVLFSLPQDQLPLVLKRLHGHQVVRLEAYDRAGASRLSEGRLASLDNQIDTTTGAIKLRGSFANHDGVLFPNQFVNLKVLLDTRHQVVVVPAAALLRGSQGAYVYQLNDDRTVSVRPVTVGPAGRSEVLIEQGLKGDERLVIDGTDKLREGISVQLASGRGAAAGAAGGTHGSASGAPAAQGAPAGKPGSDASGSASHHHHGTAGQEAD